MSDVLKTIRSYVLENFLFTSDESALRNDESFLESGFIDSTGVMEIMLFIEDEFGISVEDGEMIPANLDSVNNLAAFIQRKTSAK